LTPAFLQVSPAFTAACEGVRGRVKRRANKVMRERCLLSIERI